MKNYSTSYFKSILLGGLLFVSSLSIAQFNAIPQSIVFPTLPANHCTNTFANVSLQIGCINAVYAGTTVNIVGTTINVVSNYTIGPICLGALSFPTHNVNLGMLPVGNYTVISSATWNAVAQTTTVSQALTVGSIGCCPAQPSFTASADTVCVGDAVTFTNTSVGATSHEWFEDNVSVGTQTNYSKTYTVAGTYEIKLGATDGVCSDTAVQELFVSAYPTVDLGNDTTTCPDQVITLDAGAGRDAILWSTSATSRFLTANTAGTYHVLVDENGCTDRDTIVVSMFPAAPALDLGADTLICAGDSLILDATAAGVTYLWHDNSMNPTYIAKTAGSYSVVIEDANTCKNSDAINIGIYANPTVSMSVVPRNNICFGSPYEFRAASFTQGSTMYQWKVNTVNSGAPTANNKFLPTLNYGDSVNVDLLTDVCSTSTYAIESNYIKMFINPEPKLIGGTAVADTVVENKPSNYIMPIIPGSSFTWSAVGGTITSPIGNAVTVNWGIASPSGKIMVTEKDAGNCSYTNERDVVIISIVGIKDENNHIGIGNAYPNPANTVVTIPLVANSSWMVDVSLFDMTGKKVQAIYNGEVAGNKNITFNVSNLKNGVYFYKVSTDDGYESVKKISIIH